MRRQVGLFWGSAVAAAAGFALLSALFLPFDALRLETAVERQRVWLLTLWTGGVLGILFGVSALFGTLQWIGVRDVAAAGSVRAAIEERNRVAVADGQPPFHRNFGWWLVVCGGLLVILYFGAWVALR